MVQGLGFKLALPVAGSDVSTSYRLRLPAAPDPEILREVSSTLDRFGNKSIFSTMSVRFSIHIARISRTASSIWRMRTAGRAGNSQPYWLGGLLALGVVLLPDLVTSWVSWWIGDTVISLALLTAAVAAYRVADIFLVMSSMPATSLAPQSNPGAPGLWELGTRGAACRRHKFRQPRQCPSAAKP
jgi:hypothetical protein